MADEKVGQVEEAPRQPRQCEDGIHHASGLCCAGTRFMAETGFRLLSPKGYDLWMSRTDDPMDGMKLFPCDVAERTVVMRERLADLLNGFAAAEKAKTLEVIRQLKEEKAEHKFRVYIWEALDELSKRLEGK